MVTLGYSIESGGVEALLDELYLDVRGQGLGSILLDRVLDEARNRGAQRLFLETEAANERARAFYLRHHFHQDDSIWLSIDLAEPDDDCLSRRAGTPGRPEQARDPDRNDQSRADARRSGTAEPLSDRHPEGDGVGGSKPGASGSSGAHDTPDQNTEQWS